MFIFSQTNYQTIAYLPGLMSALFLNRITLSALICFIAYICLFISIFLFSQHSLHPQPQKLFLLNCYAFYLSYLQYNLQEEANLIIECSICHNWIHHNNRNKCSLLINEELELLNINKKNMGISKMCIILSSF